MAAIIHDGIGPVLGFLAANAAQNVASAMNDGADQVELHAKATAPWSDITGQARSGLAAEVSIEGGEVVLELGHAVDYGYWLEVIQGGRFAVIMPTLELFAPDIFQNAGASMISVGRSY